MPNVLVLKAPRRHACNAFWCFSRHFFARERSQKFKVMKFWNFGSEKRGGFSVANFLTIFHRKNSLKFCHRKSRHIHCKKRNLPPGTLGASSPNIFGRKTSHHVTDASCWVKGSWRYPSEASYPQHAQQLALEKRLTMVHGQGNSKQHIDMSTTTNGRLIFIHTSTAGRCCIFLPFQRQRCIKLRVLWAQCFYAPLALNCQKREHIPALGGV